MSLAIVSTANKSSGHTASLQSGPDAARSDQAFEPSDGGWSCSGQPLPSNDREKRRPASRRHLCRSLRITKKLHRRWLDWVAVDLSQDARWRARLFNAAHHEEFKIDWHQQEGLPSRLAATVVAYDLRFCVAKVYAEEAEPWLSHNGCVVFKFWAEQFPEVNFFSGNNPDVV